MAKKAPCLKCRRATRVACYCGRAYIKLPYRAPSFKLPRVPSRPEMGNRLSSSYGLFPMQLRPILRVTDWAHGNAGFWLRDIGGGEKAFWYTKEQLLWAAAFCADEFQISCEFELRSMEQCLFKVLVAANTQLAGLWRTLSWA